MQKPNFRIPNIASADHAVSDLVWWMVATIGHGMRIDQATMEEIRSAPSDRRSFDSFSDYCAAGYL